MKGALVYLSLGSNLGDRVGNLNRAVALLEGILSDPRRSSIYETRPLYFTDQPEFLNMVVCGHCRLSPRALLKRIQGIEAALGRRRRGVPAKGPRIIDIDILLYGESVHQERDLRIPHPGIRERQFVLVPLLELDEQLRDPQTGRTFAQAVQALGDQGVYIFDG